MDYEIKGHEMQLVEIELDPRETVIAEAGAMMFLDNGIDFKTKFGDGSEPKQTFFKKLMSAGGRLLTGESLFITHFTNQGQSKARVAFAAPFPGTKHDMVIIRSRLFKKSHYSQNRYCHKLNCRKHRSHQHGELWQSPHLSKGCFSLRCFWDKPQDSLQ